MSDPGAEEIESAADMVRRLLKSNWIAMDPSVEGDFVGAIIRRDVAIAAQARREALEQSEILARGQGNQCRVRGDTDAAYQCYEIADNIRSLASQEDGKDG